MSMYAELPTMPDMPVMRTFFVMLNLLRRGRIASASR